MTNFRIDTHVLFLQSKDEEFLASVEILDEGESQWREGKKNFQTVLIISRMVFH